MIEVTKEFKKSLKNAETLIVRFNYNTVTLELDAKGDKNDQRLIISYERKHHHLNPCREGFFMISYVEMGTAAVLYHLLKPGMFLNLDYYCNSSNYLAEAELHNDELVASIYDKNKNSIIKRIVIDRCICKNNSARALKF